MLKMAGPDVDVCIHEIGGTVGDIESLPFLEAARQVRRDVGRSNTIFLHVSLVPFIGPSAELKTNPTQHSVAALRQVGIQPDAIVCRASMEIPEPVKRKIALMCDVDEEAVISCPDASSIYEIPRVLHAEGLDAYLVRKLGLSFRDVDWSRWNDLLDRVRNPKEEVDVGLVGKYIDLPDAYLSVCEALRAGGFGNRVKVNIHWVASDLCETSAGAREQLGALDGIVVPGGFGIRGVEGKLGALRFARENQLPTLGLCLGLQCMVIEAARDLLGLPDAASTEFEPDTKAPVVATMAEQVEIVAGEGDMGATMRLGAYPAELTPGSIVADAYGTTRISERPRHRYEVNNAYRADLEAHGLLISGTSPDSTLVENVELSRDLHPYYVGTQGHPELKSRPTRPHPLFLGLVRAALRHKRSSRLPVESDDQDE
jgi:CTP synthase